MKYFYKFDCSSILKKVYTIDLRNHGNTLPYFESMSYPEMAEDLHNFVKTIVIEKDKCKSVSLLGHSMGGKTAMNIVLNDVNMNIFFNNIND